MKRKTVSVKSLVDRANEYLASDTHSQEKKETIACFISFILHETGNYRGYSYLFPWEDTDECRAKEYNRCYHYSEGR
jgi:transcription initiation factor TFIIIB Brf1 subunit/transcription initiation factor TFIIB